MKNEFPFNGHGESGENKDDPLFFLEKFFSKGSQIIVSGRMQSDTVKGDDGKNHKYWKLIGNDFDFCDSKGTPRGDSNLDDLGDSFKAAEDDIPF